MFWLLLGSSDWVAEMVVVAVAAVTPVAAVIFELVASDNFFIRILFFILSSRISPVKFCKLLMLLFVLNLSLVCEFEALSFSLEAPLFWFWSRFQSWKWMSYWKYRQKIFFLLKMTALRKIKYLNKTQVFPTPESPMSRSLKRRSFKVTYMNFSWHKIFDYLVFEWWK